MGPVRPNAVVLAGVMVSISGEMCYLGFNKTKTEISKTTGLR